jgi:hypothetical protein
VRETLPSYVESSSSSSSRVTLLGILCPTPTSLMSHPDTQSIELRNNESDMCLLRTSLLELHRKRLSMQGVIKSAKDKLRCYPLRAHMPSWRCPFCFQDVSYLKVISCTPTGVPMGRAIDDVLTSHPDVRDICILNTAVAYAYGTVLVSACCRTCADAIDPPPKKETGASRMNTTNNVKNEENGSGSKDALRQRALQNYAFFHGVQLSSVSVSDVRQSSAGLLGWARATLDETEATRAGISIEAPICTGDETQKLLGLSTLGSAVGGA